MRSTNLPSKRYPLWIDMFTRKVAEAQKTIEDLSANENVYNVISSYFSELSLPNEIDINPLGSSVYVEIRLTEQDRFADFVSVVTKLGKKLYDENLHDNPSCLELKIPDTYKRGYLQISRMAYCYRDRRKGTRDRHVSVNLQIPRNGCQDLAVTQDYVERVTTDIEYTFHKKQPSHAAFDVPVIDTKGQTNAKLILDNPDPF